MHTRLAHAIVYPLLSINYKKNPQKNIKKTYFERPALLEFVRTVYTTETQHKYQAKFNLSLWIASLPQVVMRDLDCQSLAGLCCGQQWTYIRPLQVVLLFVLLHSGLFQFVRIPVAIMCMCKSSVYWSLKVLWLTSVFILYFQPTWFKAFIYIRTVSYGYGDPRFWGPHVPQST